MSLGPVPSVAITLLCLIAQAFGAPRDFEECLTKAEAGSIEAQQELAWRYRGGFGVEVNSQLSDYWYANPRMASRLMHLRHPTNSDHSRVCHRSNRSVPMKSSCCRAAP
jgi:hypothetical protein